MNKHWPRWIFASMAKHFKDACDAVSLPIFIEGSPRATDKHQDWAEFRIDGPYFTVFTKNHWSAKVEVNIVVSSAMNQTNNYRLHTNNGIICAAFTENIPAFKLGAGVEDTQELLACFALKSDKKERLVVSNFGQINPSLQLLQSTIEGHYTADLSL